MKFPLSSEYNFNVDDILLFGTWLKYVEYKCLIILLLNSKFILLTGSLKLLRIFANCFKDIS